MRKLYDELLTKSELFANAPFEQICIGVGIDTAQPKSPWLDRLSRKKRQLTAIIEFDWNEVRDWTADQWFEGLIPLVNEAIRMASEKYNLPVERFESEFNSWNDGGIGDRM